MKIKDRKNNNLANLKCNKMLNACNKMLNKCNKMLKCKSKYPLKYNLIKSNMNVYLSLILSGNNHATNRYNGNHRR